MGATSASEGRERPRRRASAARDRGYLALVALALLLLIGGVLQTVPPLVGGGVAGRARNVDMERVRRMIEQGQLSDHPAEFVHPVK